MEQEFWTAFAASAIAAMVTTAGILLVRRREAWTRRNTTYFACFAAGVLITVSFLHIVPKSISMNGQAAAFLLAGYLLMYAFDRFLRGYACGKPQTAEYALGFVPLLGIGLHSFLDGVTFAIGFTVSLFTGVLMAIGMILHEFPEGIVIYALLLRSGVPERRSFLLAFLAAALTTPFGTLVAYPFVSRIDSPVLGALLAFSGGTLVYVSATHLLPQAEKDPRRFSTLAFGAGILVALGIIASHV